MIESRFVVCKEWVWEEGNSLQRVMNELVRVKENDVLYHDCGVVCVVLRKFNFMQGLVDFTCKLNLSKAD